MAICLQPKQSDFRGYPFGKGAYSYTKTVDFIKNNCPSGQTGSVVPYSKTYTSYISEADLQSQISTDISNFNTEGQANANSTGTCSTTCVAKTTTQIGGRLISMDSTDVYMTHLNVPIASSEGISGSYKVPRSLLMSGSGSIPSQTYIHNLCNRPNVLVGSNLAYRMAMNSSGQWEYIVGYGTSKCSETTIYSNLPGIPTGIIFDYKTVYAGLGHPLNGLFYVSMINASRLGLYFLPDGFSPSLVGYCDAPTVSTGSDFNYGFHSPVDGFTRAYLGLANNGDLFVIAYARRFNTGLTSFDNNRTRALVWQVNKDIFGEPTGVTEVYHRYNNDRLHIDSVTNWGNGNVAFFYRLLRGSNKHGVFSWPNNLPGAGLSASEAMTSAVGNMDYIIGVVNDGSNWSRIRVYNIATGIWSNGRTP